MNEAMAHAKQKKQIYGFIISTVIAVVMYVMPSPYGLTPTQWHLMALTAWLVSMWIFEVYDPAIAGLSFLGLVLLLQLTTANVALSGFATPIFWMLFCIYIWIKGFQKTGMEKRALLTLLSKVKVTYPRIVIALFIIGIVTDIMNPALMFIINISFALVLGDFMELIGEKRFSKTTECIFFALMLAAYVPSRLILVQPENMVAVSFFTKFTGETIYYMQWLWYSIANLPLVIIALVTTLCIFKPDKPMTIPQDDIKAELSKLGPMTSLEKRCIMLLGFTVLLWITDALHKIPPTTVGIAMTTAFFMPKIGILDAEDLKGVNWWTPVFMGAAICLGSIMADSGIATWMANGFESSFGKIGGIPFFYGMALVAFIVNILVTPMGGYAALSTPFMKYAVSAGMNPIVVPIALGTGFTLWLFPYEIAPILVVYGAGYQMITSVMKKAATFSILGMVITPPFAYYWCKWIGLV
jgi:solute carrier family 13 (sodium-dependent dicarboxylate transporter), member 2/3/5